ncbi:MAG: hypothetical protein HGB15_00225 [Chlorobaculum sp.]|nr:hypothetical protein [Chlorobaculum sp.]
MNPIRLLVPTNVCGDTSFACVNVAWSLIGVLYEWICKRPSIRAGNIADQNTLDIAERE